MNYFDFQGDIAKIDSSFFEKNKISEKDKKYIEKLFSIGEYITAIDFFSEKYLNKYSREYKNYIRYQLLVASNRRFTTLESEIIDREISSGSKIFTDSIVSISSIVLSIYLDQKMKELDLPDELGELIKERYKKRFEENYNTRLGTTRRDVSDLIREIQIEIQSDELEEVRKAKEQGIELKLPKRKKKLKKYAKRRLRKELSREDYEDLLNGQLIKTNDYITPTGKITNRRLFLEDYLNMSIDNIILDSDRDIEEVNAKYNGDDVVEYYKRDYRPVKKEREACKFILAQSKYSKPLLALSEEAAQKYQIMTVEEARGFLDGAMGPYCRHSFRRISKAYAKKLAEEVA